MVRFIDNHTQAYGVEPICSVLPIAPSTCYAHKSRQADPSLRSVRSRRDEELSVEIRRVWDAKFGVYGVRKLWRQLRRVPLSTIRRRILWRFCRMITWLGLPLTGRADHRRN